MAGQYLELFIPLLLHMGVTELVMAVCGRTLDSASATTLTAVLVIPAAIFMMRKDKIRHGSKTSEHEKGIHAGVLTGIGCFIAGGILNILWSGVLKAIHLDAVFSNTTQEALFAGQILIQFLGLGILVPIAEELIFRGLIYRRMRRLMPVKAAIFCSVLLFAVYHGNMIQILFALPMALVLTVLYEKEKLLLFPVLFHMGANLIAVAMNFF